MFTLTALLGLSLAFAGNPAKRERVNPAFVTGTPRAIQAGNGYEWRPFPDGTEFALMHNGVQVGGWNIVREVYRPILSNGQWGPAVGQPPVSAPGAQGVMRNQMDSLSRFSLGAKEVTREAAEQVIGDSRLPDLSGKLRVTIIGPKELTDPVMKDLQSNPTLQAYSAEIVASAFEAGDWQVASDKTGYVTTGRPTIHITSAQGASLARQENYASGADGLAKNLAVAKEAIEKIRKPNPNYKPETDTDATRPSSSSGFDGAIWLIIIVAIVALVFWARYQAQK